MNQTLLHVIPQFLTAAFIAHPPCLGCPWLLPLYAPPCQDPTCRMCDYYRRTENGEFPKTSQKNKLQPGTDCLKPFSRIDKWLRIGQKICNQFRRPLLSVERVELQKDIFITASPTSTASPVSPTSPANSANSASPKPNNRSQPLI